MIADEKQPLLSVAQSLSPANFKDGALLPQTTRAAYHTTELYGYAFMAVSCLGFSGMTFTVHMAEKQFHFPPLSAQFIRALVQTALCLVCIFAFVDIRQNIARLTRYQIKLLAFRGSVGALGIICVYKSLQLLPIGDAVTIFFFGPIITMLLSNLVLAEPITPLDGIAAVSSFIGVLLISRPGFKIDDIFNSHRIAGSLFAFGGAFFSSVAYVTIRNLGTSIHFILSVLSLGLGSIITSVTLGGAVGPGIFISMREGALLVLISSLFAFAGQCCLTKGLQHCRAGPGVLIRNVDVPLAYILGLLFLGEAPSWLSLCGSCMVLFSAVMLGVRQIINA